MKTYSHTFFESQWRYLLLFAISFIFVFLFSCTTSPFYNGYPFWFYGDSGVFQQMGLCILKGETPYVDLFDHKGPILFLIQALGLWISRDFGLCLLQSLSLFATLVMCEKTIRLYCSRPIVIVSLLGSTLAFLLAFYQRGNLCEEWSLPFISLPIFLFFKRNKADETFTLSDSFIVGCCFAIIAYIRLNNAAPICGFILYHFIFLLKGKNYRRILTDICLLLAGIVAVSIPVFIYFLCKAGWYGVSEMLYGTFIFNFIYMAGGDTLSMWEKIQYFIPPIGFLIITLICTKKQIFNIAIPIIISYVLTLLSLGNAHFNHYLMVFIPLFVVSLAILSQSLSKICFVILGCILMQCFNAGYSAIDCLAFRVLGKQPDNKTNIAFHEFVSSLPEDEKSSIWNYNLGTGFPEMFAEEGIVQCNRFLTDSHIVISDKFQEYNKQHNITTEDPTWILALGNPDSIIDIIGDNYVLYGSIPSTDGCISCFCRN